MGLSWTNSHTMFKYDGLMRFAVSTSALFLVTQLMSACCNCEDEARRTQRLKWTDASLVMASYALDSSGIRIESTSDSVFTDSGLALFYQIEGEVIAVRQQGRRDWFGTAAYACKCDEPRYDATSAATSLRVTTLFDFDPRHPAGSAVTEYFKSSGYRNGRVVLFPLTVPDMSNLQLPGVEVQMLLDARPAVPGPQRFAVTLEMSDGVVFRDTTAALRF